MSKLRLLAVAALAWLVVGCGAGETTPFTNFFGTGLTPGGVLAIVKPGEIHGVILRRTSDGRILILGDAGETTDPNTPVEGATVTLVELSLSGVTGATGQYRFTEVSAGTYTLRIKLPEALGGSSAEFTLKVDPGSDVGGISTES